MFCSLNPIMNPTLFTFSIWKDFVTFSELQHWMEETSCMHTAGFSTAVQMKMKIVKCLPQIMSGLFSGIWKWSYFLPGSGYTCELI